MNRDITGKFIPNNLNKSQKVFKDIKDKSIINKGFKNLIYDGRTYPEYMINKYGELYNVKTDNIIKEEINHNGYYVSYLRYGNPIKIKQILQHRAVAETFLPNTDHKEIVHHKDGTRTNFDVSNLKLMTQKEHVQLHIQQDYENGGWANGRKLNSNEVRYIRKSEKSLNKLAKQFHINKSSIRDIKLGKYYKDI